MLRAETIRLISVRRARKGKAEPCEKENAFFVIDFWVEAKWPPAMTNRLKNAF